MLASSSLDNTFSRYQTHSGARYHITRRGGILALAESVGMVWPQPAVSDSSASINQDCELTQTPTTRLWPSVSGARHDKMFFCDSSAWWRIVFYHGRCQIEKMDGIWVWAPTIGECLYTASDGADSLLPWQHERIHEKADMFLVKIHSARLRGFNEVTVCSSGRGASSGRSAANHGASELVPCEDSFEV